MKFEKLKNNDLDLYEFQKQLRIPKSMTFEIRKVNSKFIYDNPSETVVDSKENKLYNFLIKLGFISFLEEGNLLKPIRKKFEFDIEKEEIRSKSLSNLSMQENLSNCDSGFFTLFYENEKLKMAYVEKERSVKIFDVFNRKVEEDNDYNCIKIT